ncbi:hypothetical protein [Flagellimonas allohymeniacidonis]|uniref:Uncharacterized protein n=1 Tax=Flagellimonas allohymeniacidonis TaxID=2517819 RepID=A0A4Q8QDM0_9FLAO|nr:hypothetical protein [Allomuricauda hymeniacidonis]TAI48491.1 hypothetical protein EW142_01415 [Allomuricauda hymeniacidonis]
MGKLKPFFFCVVVSITFSCDFLEGQDKPQIFPEYDYSAIEELVLYEFETDNQVVINDFSTIERIRQTFLDQESYFKNELRKFNGVKPDYSITLFSLKDTLELMVYPTPIEDKIELGFTEKYDPKNPMKTRLVHRFYMNREILELLR